jgi:hypothetical protein
MKFLRLLIVFLIVQYSAIGNIVTSKVYISEIFIDTPKSWLLELAFPDDPGIITFDSMVIETSIGKSRVINYSLIDTTVGNISKYLTVLSNYNLSKELDIDRDNDFVKVYSYILGGVSTDYLAFGNYPGSFFQPFLEGYSIARTPDGTFSLDKTPSLGEINSEDGMFGTVEGYLLDRNQVRQAYSEVYAFGYDISTDGNGYYSESVPSRTYIIYDTTMAQSNKAYIYIPDTFNVIPDSVTVKDIVLLSYYTYSAIIYREPTYSPQLSFMNFPNPFRDFTVFYFILPQIRHYKTVTLEIFNNMGESVASVRLPEEETGIALSSNVIGNLAAGTYHYTLFFDGKPSGHLNTMVKLP